LSANLFNRAVGTQSLAELESKQLILWLYSVEVLILIVAAYYEYYTPLLCFITSHRRCVYTKL